MTDTPTADPFVVAFDGTMLDLVHEWVGALGLTLDEYDPDVDSGMRTFAAVIPPGHPLRARSPLAGHVTPPQRRVEDDRRDRVQQRIARGVEAES